MQMLPGVETSRGEAFVYAFGNNGVCLKCFALTNLEIKVKLILLFR